MFLAVDNFPAPSSGSGGIRAREIRKSKLRQIWRLGPSGINQSEITQISNKEKGQNITKDLSQTVKYKHEDCVYSHLVHCHCVERSWVCCRLLSESGWWLLLLTLLSPSQLQLSSRSLSPQCCQCRPETEIIHETIVASYYHSLVIVSPNDNCMQAK